ncbi:hypothetical protein ACI2LF_12995 [Kribbella sp. NPDC020789]
MTELHRFDVAPEDVTSWLTANGWERISSGRGAAALWTRARDELLQPLTQEALDYPLRLDEMLRTLSKVEERDPTQLTQEIANEGADICEWRAEGESTHDATISLEDGSRLIQGARSAFVAAANATIHRRGYFGHSSARAAREYAKSVRMAQTRRGSYIIPIISRIPSATLTARDQQDTLEIQVEAQPFERRVMARLAEALTTVEELAVDVADAPSTQILNQAVASGVSHELCASLADVLSADSVEGLSISFGWARRLPVQRHIGRVRLPKNCLPILISMAEELRGSEVVAEQTVVGYVRGHRGEPDEESREVTVRASVGQRDRLVRMSLGRDDFHQALMAADERRPVFVTGTLAREPGRQWRFDSISNFGYAEFMSELDR